MSFALGFIFGHCYITLIEHDLQHLLVINTVIIKKAIYQQKGEDYIKVSCGHVEETPD